MSDLPSGWQQVPVTEFTALHDSRRVPLNAKQREGMKGEFPYYGANGLVDHINDYLFDGEYTLLAEDGGYFDDPKRGVAYEASGRFWVNNHAHILESLGGISNRFLRYALNAVNWMPHVGGSTRLKLTQGGLQQAPVSLPPLLEQRRIVAKIDSLSAKSRRARDRLNHIPRLVEKYKQAMLAAAYLEAAKLSQEETTLGEIAAEVKNGLSKKPADSPPGLPILRISAVRPMAVRLADIRYYPPTEQVPDATHLREGDLLFTRYNGNPDFTAVCGMVRDLAAATVYPDKLIRVRLSNKAAPRFVEIVCTAPQSREWLAPHIKSAAGQHGISGIDLKRMPIPLPAIADQGRIAQRTANAFAWIDRLAAEATSARKLIDRLDQAVLAKAFRGELVPQDPNDEPASVLLERIRTERAAAGTATGKGKGRSLRMAPAEPGEPRGARKAARRTK